MARYLIYRTDITYLGTIVRESATNNPGVNEASLFSSFVIPAIQPLYLWRVVGGTTVTPNTDANIAAWETHVAPPPTPNSSVTLGEVTGITNTKIDKVSGHTNQVAIFTSGGDVQSGGYTIPQLTGLTTYTFTESGGTTIKQVGNNLTIYSVTPSGTTVLWGDIIGNINLQTDLQNEFNTKLNKSTFSGYTGTTVPNTYETISNFNSYTGTTAPNTYYNKSQINSYTASTTLQKVTSLGATTSIESTFNGGLKTQRIKVTGNTVNALRITKADGTTEIISINALSGFTGFGTTTPEGKIHLYGTDNSDSQNFFGLEHNSIIIDGVLDGDKDVVWSDDGTPKWLAEIFRSEAGRFWYLYNQEGQLDVLTISESGRVGINSPTNIMNGHTTIISGITDGFQTSGLYDKNYISIYQTRISDAVSFPNKYQWRVSKDLGNTYSAWSVSSGATTGNTSVGNGVFVNFETTTGFTVGDAWQFPAFPQLPIATTVISPNFISESLYTFDYTAVPTQYIDVTGEVNSPEVGYSLPVFNTGTTDNAILVGTLTKISSLFVNTTTFGVGVTLVTEYWDGSTWVDISIGNPNYIDGTNNLTQIGSISWDNNSVVGWIKDYIPDVSGSGYQLYWLRFRTISTPSVAPILQNATRGGETRFAVMASPFDVHPAMYVDALGRINIGGGNITGTNVFQINRNQNVPISDSTNSYAEIDSQDSSIENLKLKLSSNDNGGPGLIFVETRGTLVNGTATQSGDTLGHINMKGRTTSGAEFDGVIFCAEYVGNSTDCTSDAVIIPNNGSASVEKVRISGKGSGFGVIKPTAVIHLQSGSTTAGCAPLKFTAGLLLSSPENGAVEYNGTHYYGTTNAGRQPFAFSCDITVPNLQCVTACGANTNIETTFSTGIITKRIKPTGNTETAFQITKADGTTAIINVDTISGFTGFGTINPQGQVHAYGTDSSDALNFYGVQHNSVIVDGISNGDKNIIWAQEGQPQWLAQTYRDEKGQFWYLYNLAGNLDVLTIAESGQVGVNSPTNIMNYHTVPISGTSEGVEVHGIYNKNYDGVYQVRISDISVVPNKYEWRVSKDFGYTYGPWSAQSGTSTGQTLIDSGVLFSFVAISGYTLGDAWEFNAFTQLPQATFEVSPNFISEMNWSPDYTANPIIYTDYTGSLNSPQTGFPVTMFNTGTTLNAMYVGALTKINSLFIDLNTVGVGVTLVIEYWNGSAWVDISIGNINYEDETLNLTQTGVISWSVLDLWQQSYPQDHIEDGYFLFWLRFRTVSPPTKAPVVTYIVRGSGKRFATYTGPYDIHPSMYVDALGRINIGGGNITGCNVLQINTNANNLAFAGAQSLVEIDNEDSSIAAMLKLKLASNDACGAGILITKTRGCLSCLCNLQNNDVIGGLGFASNLSGVPFYASNISSQYIGNGSNYFADLVFRTANGAFMNPIEKMRINGKGIGFGIVVPTAILHLSSGSTGAGCAPLKFTAGGLLATPELGAVEFSNNAWYGTNASGRKTFAFLEAPQFTGNVELPSSTCLNNVNLCNLILNSGGTNNICLVQTSVFNTYTGTTVPNTYYNKSEINSYTASTLININSRLLTSVFNGFTGTTLPANYYNKSQINSYTASTNSTINNKLNTSVFNGFTGTTLPANYYNKSEINSYTASTASVINSAVTGATNGLTCNGRNVLLGGNLNQNTLISGASICLELKACKLDLGNADNTLCLEFRPSHAIFTDNSNITFGIQYASDYSGGFNGRSLVDKCYVDTVASGLVPKTSTAAATTGPINLITIGLGTIDGIQTTTGMRILVKNQVLDQFNGIYSASTGTWGRTDDFDNNPSGEVLPGNLVPVTSGSTNANTIWTLIATSPITIDVTPLNFTLFSSSSGVVAGNGICVTQTGGNYNVAIKLASNCGLCVDGTGLYVNQSIAGNSLSYTTGVLAVNISGGTLNTALNSKLNTSVFNGYTGTTAPGLYYTKSQINSYTASTNSTINNKLNTSVFNTFTGTTLPANYYNKSQINSYTASTNSTINNKLNTSIFNTFTGTTAPATYLAISLFNSFTGTTLPANYYNKSQINSYTASTNSTINNKLNTSVFNGYTGTTAPGLYYTKSQINSYTGATATLIGTKAPLANPALTGVPTSTTAAQDTSTNQIATTCFVVCQASSSNPLMDGSVAIGTCLRYARADHVHPTDTSRLAVTCFNLFTGTTAPATYASKANAITGATNLDSGNAIYTSVSANKLQLKSISGGTGISIDNTANLIRICGTPTWGSITGSITSQSDLNSCLNAKAYLSGATFTGIVRGVTPTTNDSSTCFATTAYYTGQAATANPLINGAVAIGTSLLFARQDHVHPRDTSKLSLSGGTMTGSLRINAKLSVCGNATVSGTTNLIGATTGSTLYLTTTPPAATISGSTVFWNTGTKQLQAKVLTGGTDYYRYCECTTSVSTTCTSAAQMFVCLCTTNWTAGTYSVDFSTILGNSNSNGCTIGQFGLDGTVIGRCFFGQIAQANYTFDAALSRDVTLTAGTHCFTIQYLAGSNTACACFGSIRAKRIC